MSMIFSSDKHATFADNAKIKSYSISRSPWESEPLRMRQTLFIDDEMFQHHLSKDIIATMLLQKVDSSCGDISDEMIEWCHNNCSQMWTIFRNKQSEHMYLMFHSSSDMTLFLTVWGGG